MLPWTRWVKGVPGNITWRGMRGRFCSTSVKTQNLCLVRCPVWCWSLVLIPEGGDVMRSQWFMNVLSVFCQAHSVFFIIQNRKYHTLNNDGIRNSELATIFFRIWEFVDFFVSFCNLFKRVIMHSPSIYLIEFYVRHHWCVNVSGQCHCIYLFNTRSLD